MEKTKVNGVELEYEATGQGEPVLLISTGPIRDSFLPFLSEAALAERYRLIRYRQRRTAASTDNPAPVSFAEHAADAAALLGALGVRRAHVVGHSTGAAIALQMGLDFPELVGTLALLEPPLMGVPSAGAFLEKAGPALEAYGSGAHEAAMTGFLSVVSGLDGEACRAVIERSVPGGLAQAITDADNFFGSYLPALVAWQFGPEQAAAIRQPVLSVLGADTEPLFADSHELLHSWLPQVEDCPVSGVAHLLHMQRPAPVALGVAAFFGRHPITASGPGPLAASSAVLQGGR
jgi:pimeloyl-ACP methyl ester carboxylesterase